MQQFLKEHKLAMNLDDINIVQAYFLSQRRDPTITEIKVLDTYRSDHCRHTTFMTKIHGVEIQTPEHSPIGKDIRASLTLFHKHRSQDNDETSLMELATSYTKHLKKNAHLNPSIHNLVDSEEINACSFTTEVEMADGTKEEREIQFKNETHNHPTEIEPFGGAATCLGGCIRDPMSGRSWVFQAMRISGSGDPTLPVSETLAGKLAQRTISQIAAQGYSSYGNQIGIHTGMVKNFFHP